MISGLALGPAGSIPPGASSTFSTGTFTENAVLRGDGTGTRGIQDSSATLTDAGLLTVATVTATVANVAAFQASGGTFGNANSDRTVLGSGSVSLTVPGIYRRDDTNTGLGFNGTDSVSLITGGVARITVGSTGDVLINNSLSIKQAANGKAGTFTLVAGSAVVANTAITANSVIIPTVKTAGGVRAGNPDCVPNPGVGFTATGGASDTSVYNYIIIEATP